MKRLAFSLSELRIAMPMSPASLSVVLHEVVRRNRVRWGIVYLQITRGVSRRDHAFPPAGTAPAIVVTARNLDLAGAEKMAARRRRRHLGAGKPLGSASISSRCRCCPTCWRSRRRASRAPAKPGSSIPKGRVTEGSSSNAWIVTRDGKVVTRQADHGILKGITRTVVLEAIAAQGLKLEERAFTLEEAYAAREAFITSASQIVLPVVKIDGRPVGNGAPGLIASALRRDFHRYAEIS